MPGSEQKPNMLPQRLCSEIQLFDLCDLNSCRYKKGRFCSDPDLLNRFEKIAEDELRTPERYVSEDIVSEEGDIDGDGEESGEFAMEDFANDEGDGWEDEE